MKNILVVDDDPDYLKLLRTMIGSGSGYLVFSANNGVEADLLLESMEIDLVVTDVYMPYKDGLELLFQLKGEDIPVIVISGGGKLGNDYLEPAKVFGACAILKKPFPRNDLLNALSAALPV